LASVSSLLGGEKRGLGKVLWWWDWRVGGAPGGGGRDFLAVDLEPLLHSESSWAAFLEFSTAAFWEAASAFLGGERGVSGCGG